MAAAIIDLYPVHLQRYREAVVLAVCLVMFILGLSCVTQVRRTQNTSVSQGISLRSPFCSRHCRGTRHVCENLHSDDVTIQRSFRRLWLVVILTEPIRHLQEPLIRKPLRHEQCKPYIQTNLVSRFLSLPQGNGNEAADQPTENAAFSCAFRLQAKTLESLK